jgi:hypothetical protein
MGPALLLPSPHPLSAALEMGSSCALCIVPRTVGTAFQYNVRPWLPTGVLCLIAGTPAACTQRRCWSGQHLRVGVCI